MLPSNTELRVIKRTRALGRIDLYVYSCGFHTARGAAYEDVDDTEKGLKFYSDFAKLLLPPPQIDTLSAGNEIFVLLSLS